MGYIAKRLLLLLILSNCFIFRENIRAYTNIHVRQEYKPYFCSLFTCVESPRKNYNYNYNLWLSFLIIVYFRKVFRSYVKCALKSRLRTTLFQHPNGQSITSKLLCGRFSRKNSHFPCFHLHSKKLEFSYRQIKTNFIRNRFWEFSLYAKKL